MARQVIRLTDKQIKTTDATGKEFTLSDGDGLQLRKFNNYLDCQDSNKIGCKASLVSWVITLPTPEGTL